MIDKCSKISNNFLFKFSTKMWVIRAGSPKMLVGIGKREDPDQTASCLHPDKFHKNKILVIMRKFY